MVEIHQQKEKQWRRFLTSKICCSFENLSAERRAVTAEVNGQIFEQAASLGPYVERFRLLKDGAETLVSVI